MTVSGAVCGLPGSGCFTPAVWAERALEGRGLRAAFFPGGGGRGLLPGSCGQLVDFPAAHALVTAWSLEPQVSCPLGQGAHSCGFLAAALAWG